MKLFISWSGKRSGKVAKAFKDYLPKIIKNLEKDDIFLSLSDLKSGDIWFSEIQENLRKCDTVLVLLTEENIDSKWLLFEAGAISNKEVNNVHICTIDNLNIFSTSPFYNYQISKCTNKDNTLELILSLLSKEEEELQATINFEKQWKFIEDILKKVKNKRNIKDKIKIISNSIKTEALNLVDDNNENSPFIEAFLGWYSSLEKEVIKPAALHSFVTSSRFYHYCLSALHNSGVNNLKAIADLSSTVENWENQQNDLWSGIDERIFYIEWETIVSDTKLAPVIKIIRRSLEKISNQKCKIYLITSKEIKSLTIPKLNKQEPLGYNFLFLNPTLIGGYIMDSNNESLYLKATNKDEELVVQMQEFYSNTKNISFEVIDENKDENERQYVNYIRKEWINKNNYGKWDNLWTDNPCTYDYVKNYDINIHLWTPNYDKLIIKCSDIIQDELIKLFRETHKSLKIFEIGYGTGGLTKAVLNGVFDINKPDNLYKGGLYKHNIPIVKYIGTDNSSDMHDIFKNTLKEDFKNDSKLEFDIRDDQFNLNFSIGEKVDIVFGSFILHHILNNEQIEIQNIFEYIANDILVSSKSSMIFLCTIFSEKETEKEIQLNYWKNHMKNMGLSEDLITGYLKGNQSMINAPTLDSLKTVAEKFNFEFIRKEIETNSPFSIIILSRIE